MVRRTKVETNGEAQPTARPKTKRSPKRTEPTSKAPDPLITVKANGEVQQWYPWLNASEFQGKDLSWIRGDLLPAYTPILLTGDTGMGKSSFLSAVIGAVTSGSWHDGVPSAVHGRTLYYQCEEDPGKRLQNRLSVNRTLLRWVFYGDYSPLQEKLKRTQLPFDLARLSDSIWEQQIKLLVFDPITSYLAPDFNVNDAGAVRALLEALGEVCAKTECSCIYTTHYRKSTDGNPLNRIAGSAAWYQVPRMILCMGENPTRPEERVLAVPKCSLTGRLPSLLYRLVPSEGSIMFEFAGPTDVTADDLKEVGLPKSDRECLNEACAWLSDSLKDGEKPAKDMVRTAAENGISLATLRRAKTNLQIKSRPVGPNGNRIQVWTPPPQPDHIVGP